MGSSGNGGNGGLVDYFRHRPPGVLFLLCLLSFAVTTMALSFYIRHSGDAIRNPDVLDWNTLLLETGSLHFCMHNQTYNAGTVNNNSGNEIVKQDAEDRANTTVSVSVGQEWRQELKEFGRVTAVSVINLHDMGRKVPHEYKSHRIVVSFVLDPAESTDRDPTLCLKINAPKFLLKDVNSGRNLPSQDNCSLPSEDITVHLPSTSAEYGVGWCDEGRVFKMELESQPSWTVAINGDDQALIHLHLMVTSAFLFVLVGIILLGIFVRGLFATRRIQLSSSGASSSGHQPFRDEEMDF